jgi:glycosyltransferase involved in cell wall biosynthesis
MRILICSEYAPLPPFNGARLVLTSLLDELRKRHEVRLLVVGSRNDAARCDPESTRTVVVERPRWLFPFDVARATATGRPLRLDAQAHAAAGPLVEEIASFDPDVVQVLTGGLAGVWRYLGDRPNVLSAIDASHLNWAAQAQASGPARRWLLSQEARRVRAYEGSEFPNFDRVVVVSERDRAALAALSPALSPTVIPNGVDAEYYAPGPQPGNGRTVVFHGALDFAPNVTAARFLTLEIWPRVLAEEPSARLMLVGRDPAPAVQELARERQVTVTGAVPDVRPLLRDAGVYLCPMLTGTGIKNKLLEAMAVQLPCVATPLALGGIEPEGARHIVLGQSPSELAEAAVSLMRDDGRRRALGAGGRAYVVAHHSWSSIAARYEELYEQVAAARAPVPAPLLDQGTA